MFTREAPKASRRARTKTKQQVLENGELPREGANPPPGAKETAALLSVVHSLPFSFLLCGITVRREGEQRSSTCR